MAGREDHQIGVDVAIGATNEVAGLIHGVLEAIKSLLGNVANAVGESQIDSAQSAYALRNAMEQHAEELAGMAAALAEQLELYGNGF